MSKLKIKKFRIEEMKPYRVILIVGKRGTGKTTLLQDILYNIRHRVDVPYAMTPTLDTAEMFESCMPKSHVYNDYNLEAMQNILKVMETLAKAKKKRSGLIALDDCMYDKSIMKGKDIRFIHMNGRHYYIWFINCMQYVMDMGPDLRSQVDYLFVLKENILSNRQKLYKYFFGMFSKYEEFALVMDKCTQNYEALVLDNTRPTNKLEDCLYYYKANPNLPKFRVGRKVYYQLDKYYRRTDEEEEARKRHSLITRGVLPCPKMPELVKNVPKIEQVEKC